MADRSRFQAMFGVTLAVLCCACGLRAQDEQNADDPTRGVARISVVQGEVNVKRGDSGEVVAAALNAPLMTQDQLETADGSRSEIQFDAANMVRLAPNTEVSLADVQRGRYQLQLGSGTIIFRVIRDSQAEAEIDTPSISIRPAGRGIIRVSVGQDGATEVTVRSGTANINSPSGSQSLRAGQTMLVRGTSADPEFQIEAEVSRDQFDDWSNNRDQQLLASRSSQYVSADIYGAEDLDAYGSWVSSSYGNVWAPRVEAGWAPYHSGRWAWEDYYGWTWVDYAPWGWAPFHYGRWFMNGGRGWCWWPGPVRQPHYWRPALVGFFGFGGVGVSVGIGFGNVGWVPLAPYEAWHPWYGRGWYGQGGYNRTLVNSRLISNTNIYSTYRNARFNNGVAYTNVNSFGRGSQRFYAANGGQIRNASLVRGQLPVTPERSSLAFTNRNAGSGSLNYRQPANRQFYTHSRAPQGQRVPFSQQQNEMAQYQQRTLGFRPSSTGQQMQTESSSGQRGYRPGTAQNTNGYSNVPRPPNSSFQQRGWQTPNTNTGTQPGQNSGWRRFGENPTAATQSPRASGNSGSGWQRPAVNAPQNRMDSRSNGSGYSRPASSDGAWRRFGAPEGNSGSRPAERAAPQADSSNAGWHRFGYPADRGSSSTPGGSNRNAGPSGSSSFGQSRGYSRPSESYRSESPMRMEQPIVHDRPSYSAPRSQQPRYQAPRSEQRYSAPRSSGAPSGGRQYQAPSGRGSRPSSSSNGGGGHRR